MLLVVHRGHEAEVQTRFARWGLHSDVVGEVTDTGRIRILDGGEVAADLPIPLLVDDVPTYTREGQPALPPPPIQLPPEPADLLLTLRDLLASPNLCSRFPAFSTYDHTVQANTVVGPGLDAALVRVRGTSLAVAMTVDCNPRYTAADPFEGARIAVAEACRNLACRGATPVAATDCLNFGNPEKPEVYWQLRRSIEGLAETCRALDVPIVSGNVSLYNETNGQAIKPSPIVGVVGLLEDVERRATGDFKRDGDVVLLLGPIAQQATTSEYLAFTHAIEVGPVPALDLATERAVQETLREMIARGLVDTAHDLSEGGLAVALAESAFAGGRGCRVENEAWERLVAAAGGRADLALFGEGQSRILIACSPERRTEVEQLARDKGVDVLTLGVVGGDELRFGAQLAADVEQLREAWEHGFERSLG
jgi:phosphoribosylformylglycinamidine synthase